MSSLEQEKDDNFSCREKFSCLRGPEEKSEWLALLKPCEKMAADIVNLAEVLSDQESQTIFGM